MSAAELERTFDRLNADLCCRFFSETRVYGFEGALRRHLPRWFALRKWWSAQPGADAADMRWVRPLPAVV